LAGTHGLTYVVDFLRGSKSEKIRSDHRTLPTYGIGADISKDEWFRYIKELIARGYLQQVGDEYPVVKLTRTSEAVLRGGERVELVRSVKRAKSRSGDQAYNEDLFDLLKAERAAIARAENVPAYLIFSDATLIELATYYPQSFDDLSQISGFGEVKMRTYGQQFLRVVVEYCQRFGIGSKMNEKEVKIRRESRPEKSSDTKRETLSLFRSGKSIDQIATERDLSTSTVEGHLAYWIEAGDLQLEQVVAPEKIQLIKRVALEMDGARLTPIKNMLGEQVTYGEIRAVLASRQKA
jgi:ATP-dependent DNA helicase RecQ